MTSNRKSRGLVYLVQAVDTDFIKIGKTTRAKIEARLAVLQTGCPHELTLLGVIDENTISEKELHQKFANTKVRGEWFKKDQSFEQFIAENVVSLAEYGSSPGKTINSEKVCYKCSQTKPANLVHFHKHPHTGDGLNSRCKECINEAMREKYGANSLKKKPKEPIQDDEDLWS